MLPDARVGKPGTTRISKMHVKRVSCERASLRIIFAGREVFRIPLSVRIWSFVFDAEMAPNGVQ